MKVLGLLLAGMSALALFTGTGMLTTHMPPHIQEQASRVMPDVDEPLTVLACALVAAGLVLGLAAFALWGARP